MKDWRIKKWKNDKDESLKDDEKWNNKKALKHERKGVKERMKIWNYEIRKGWKEGLKNEKNEKNEKDVKMNEWKEEWNNKKKKGWKMNVTCFENWAHVMYPLYKIQDTPYTQT